jgi:hypothetical protein
MSLFQQNSLPFVTLDLARRYVGKFDADPRVGAPDRALTDLISKFPSNDQVESVLLKVSALNGLYSTNIFAVTDVAIHISKLGIDPLLAEGSLEAVDRIAWVELGGKRRRNYSFATKYCNWHASQHYPVYDMIVDELLWLYKQKNGFAHFRRMDLLDYSRFKQIVDSFRDSQGLSALNYKTMDKFLWSLGKELMARK